MSAESRIFRVLLQYGRKRMLRRWAPDSCIAATRIAVDVLAHYGIAARPQGTRVTAITHKLLDRQASGNFDGKLRAGEYIIKIGNPESDRAVFYQGHVIALTSKHLIDMSLDQASRPHKGLCLTNAVLPWDGKFPVTVWHDDLVFGYVLFDDESFYQSPDWYDTERHADLVADIIRKIGR
jgi:hypothetical protein